MDTSIVKKLQNWVSNGISAYLIVQLTVGIQLGVAIAYGFLAYGIPISILASVTMPLGLCLVIGQYPLAISAVNNFRTPQKKVELAKPR